MQHGQPTRWCRTLLLLVVLVRAVVPETAQPPFGEVLSTQSVLTGDHERLDGAGRHLNVQLKYNVALLSATQKERPRCPVNSGA